MPSVQELIATYDDESSSGYERTNGYHDDSSCSIDDSYSGISTLSPKSPPRQRRVSRDSSTAQAHHLNQNKQQHETHHAPSMPILPPRVRWNDDSPGSVFSQSPPRGTGISQEPTNHHHHHQQRSTDSTPPGRRTSQLNNSNFSIGSEEALIVGVNNSPSFRTTASILESLDGFEDEPSDEGRLYSNTASPAAASRDLYPSPSSRITSRNPPNVTRVLPPKPLQPSQGSSSRLLTRSAKPWHSTMGKQRSRPPPCQNHPVDHQMVAHSHTPQPREQEGAMVLHSNPVVTPIHSNSSRRTNSRRPRPFAESRSPLRALPSLDEVEEELDDDEDVLKVFRRNKPSPTATNDDSNSSNMSTSQESASVAQSASVTSSMGSSQNRAHLVLHDLLADASSEDAEYNNDVNFQAMLLLAERPAMAAVQDFAMYGWTALHVACLCPNVPDFILRGLFLCSPHAVSTPDVSGRLPLHLAAASCVSLVASPATTLRLLVREYPNSLFQKDAKGLIPLHVLMRNENINITVELLRILLGQQLDSEKQQTNDIRKETVPLRRGEHLDVEMEELGSIRGSQRNVINQKKKQSPQPQQERSSLEMWDNETAHMSSLENHEDDDVRHAFVKIDAWKRKQKSSMSSVQENEASEHGNDQEQNPAAIPAPPYWRLPLHMAATRSIHASSLASESEEEDATTNETSLGTGTDSSSMLPVTSRGDVLRVLIHAYPQALVARDGFGRTPLLTSLLNQKSVPDHESVELLLGVRTSGYEPAPKWRNDEMTMTKNLPNDFNDANDDTGRYSNPAMVPSRDTYQLPLHVAGEELLPINILESIHHAYPGAIHVQDIRGRTPLHAVLGNVHGLVPNIGIVSMLLDPQVARARDDEGKLPFDGLIRLAKKIPHANPDGKDMTLSDCKPNNNHKVGSSAAVYRVMFVPEILESSPRGWGRVDRSLLSLLFLSQLKKLPPWLRREACTTGFVQRILANEIAKPFPCALILLNGIVLVLTITFFRLQLDQSLSQTMQMNQGRRTEIVENEDLGSFTSSQLSIESDGHSSDYCSFLYFASSYFLARSVYQLYMYHSLSMLVSQLFFNLWTIVDVGSAIMLLVATIFLDSGSDAMDVVGTLGAFTTGLLWLQVLRYLSRWWLNMSIFVNGFIKMARNFIFPLILFAGLAVAFAQMFYTLSETTWNLCTSDTDELDGYTVCSIYDAYILVYLIVIGTPIVNTNDDSTTPAGVMLLVVLFSIFALLLLLNIIVSVVMEASNLNVNEIAANGFWDPALTFLYMTKLGQFPCAGMGGKWEATSHTNSENAFQKKKNHRTRVPKLPNSTSSDSLYDRLEGMWNFLSCAYSMNSNSKVWYMCGGQARTTWFGRFFIQVLAFFVLPIWFLVGLATLGLLWPPQVRRWLLRPSPISRGHDNFREGAFGNGDSISDIRALHQELLNVKAMSFEKSVDVQREVSELKYILLEALQDKE